MGTGWLAFVNLFLLLLGKRTWIRISGDSMAPTFQDGDLLFLDTKAYQRTEPAARDIVVIRHPFHKDMLLIKRVVAFAQEGKRAEKVFVVGDNPCASTDSRTFGAVPLDSVQGKIAGIWKRASLS